MTKISQFREWLKERLVGLLVIAQAALPVCCMLIQALWMALAVWWAETWADMLAFFTDVGVAFINVVVTHLVKLPEWLQVEGPLRLARARRWLNEFFTATVPSALQRLVAPLALSRDLRRVRDYLAECDHDAVEVGSSLIVFTMAWQGWHTRPVWAALLFMASVYQFTAWLGDRPASRRQAAMGMAVLWATSAAALILAGLSWTTALVCIEFAGGNLWAYVRLARRVK